MKTRFLSFIVAAAFAMALTACGADETGPASSATAQQTASEQTGDETTIDGELSNQQIIDKTVERLTKNQNSAMPADGERSMTGTIEATIKQNLGENQTPSTTELTVVSESDATNKIVHSITQTGTLKVETYLNASADPFVQYSNATGEWQKQTYTSEEFATQLSDANSTQASKFFGEASDYQVVHEGDTYHITGPVNTDALFAGADMSKVTVNSSSLDFVVDDQTFDPITYSMGYDMSDSDGITQVMDMKATMEYKDITVTIPDEVLAAKESTD